MIEGIKVVSFSKVKVGQQFVRAFGASPPDGVLCIKILEVFDHDGLVKANAILLSGTDKGCYSAIGKDIKVIPL